MTINETAKTCHEISVSKGFFEGEKNIGEILCLIHSEVSEALECDRKGQYCTFTDLEKITASVSDSFFKAHYSEFFKESFEAELADIMIRVMDLAAFKGIDLEAHIAAKMRYNSLRPHKHGKKY